jgi:hypothetical protein
LIIIDKNWLAGKTSIRKRGGRRQEYNTTKYRKLHGKQIGQKRNPSGREIQPQGFALKSGGNLIPAPSYQHPSVLNNSALGQWDIARPDPRQTLVRKKAKPLLESINPSLSSQFAFTPTSLFPRLSSVLAKGP